MSRILCAVISLIWSLSAGADERLLMVLGDSLSAGYGVSVEHGWVALLEDRLEAQGYRYRVINASVSGDTSRGALARLDGLLTAHRPDVTIVELGGNDGLRGIALDEMRANLETIVRRLLDAGSRVLLLPMKLPPNYGPAYTGRFEAVYREVAARHSVTLGKFILEDIALHPELMQEDGIHPTGAAQPRILETVWGSLRPLLDAPAAPGSE